MNGPIIITSPSMFFGSIKRGVTDGEVWSLGSRLRAAGFIVDVKDSYHDKYDHIGALVSEANPNSDLLVLIHLWKLEVSLEELQSLAESLRALKRRAPKSKIGLFGYAVEQSFSEVQELASTIDVVFSATGARLYGLGEQQRTDSSDCLIAVGEIIADHLTAKPLKTSGPKGKRRNWAFAPDNGRSTSTISLHTSRGCRSGCTFCSYNSDLSKGWRSRPMADVAEEIELALTSTNCRKVAFHDNDFGGTPDMLLRRLEELYNLLDNRDLLGRAQYSVNVRSECITPQAIDWFAKIGISTALVGLESFNADTRRRLFGKKLDERRFFEALAACDARGISTVVSYILWHPWQSIQSIQSELARIQAMGRYRIPHFLSRSVLQVVPGTPIERRALREGVVHKGPNLTGSRYQLRFHRSDVRSLYERASLWYSRNITRERTKASSDSDIITRIARLKIEELEFYQKELHL